jgi:hypothetical protein
VLQLNGSYTANGILITSSQCASTTSSIYAPGSDDETAPVVAKTIREDCPKVLDMSGGALPGKIAREAPWKKLAFL